MPSIADSAVIFILALMLFGPKKLPQLARQLGKLMAEFRRASNEFRMQMEDELRVEEQKEHQKKVDAMAGPPSTLPDPEHPHLPSPSSDVEAGGTGYEADHGSESEGTAPIAESGDLRMMPPSTGLPVQSGYGMSPEPVMIDGVEYPAAVEHQVVEHQVAEHTILNSEAGVGTSSEEPVSEQTHA